MTTVLLIIIGLLVLALIGVYVGTRFSYEEQLREAESALIESRQEIAEAKRRVLKASLELAKQQKETELDKKDKEEADEYFDSSNGRGNVHWLTGKLGGKRDAGGNDSGGEDPST